jgi:hypothetical protein
MISGMASYPKLWLHYFTVVIYLNLIIQQRKELALLSLLALLFVVPVTLGIALFLLFMILYSLYKKEINAGTAYFVLVILIGFATYLLYTKVITNDFYASTNTFEKIALIEWIKRSFYFKLMLAYLIPYGIALLLMSAINMDKNIRKGLFLSTSILLFSAYICYVIFINEFDSIQLFTNVAGPLSSVMLFVATCIFIMQIKVKWKRIISAFILLCILSAECYQIMNAENHHRRTEISGNLNAAFVQQVRAKLESAVSNKVGLLIPAHEYGNASEFLFTENARELLLLCGRYYDIINIKSDSVEFNSNNYQKQLTILNQSALAIYKKHEYDPLNPNIELAFIKDKQIEYAITKKEYYDIDQPIRSLIFDSVVDHYSGTKLYLFNKN